MKKFFLFSFLFILALIIIIVGYLSIIGYQTDKFNSLLENKIKSNLPNTTIDLKNIKIKINAKNFSFFVSTKEPNIQYYNTKVNLKKIDGYINLKSLLTGKPNIEKINILSSEVDMKKFKDIAKYLKPSNFKKFFLNEVDSGKIMLNIDLYLKDNKINNYEINGIVKNFNVSLQNIKLKRASFVYFIKKDFGEINNLRGLINGFQINSGNIAFKNTKFLNIKGDLSSDLNLKKEDLVKLIEKKTLKNFTESQFKGNIKSSFLINFDETLKITNYEVEALGNIDKSKIKIKNPSSYFFLKNKIDNFNLDKTEFKIKFKKSEKSELDIKGKYKINNNSYQNFNVKYSNISNLQNVLINCDFDDEIIIPILNFYSKNKIINIETKLEVKKNSFNIQKFILKEGKNKIALNNLVLRDNKLEKLNKLTVKTFKNDKFNNDFNLSVGKEIKVKGLKYDASNLTKLIEQKNNSNFFKNMSKKINVNITEISTNVTSTIFNFNLIGYLKNGKFNKIVSKGEFGDEKYLDISLKVDKNSNRKILEIYSDLPKPLLSNYNFFDGLSGGKLLLYSDYDSNNSNTNLIIENFKVKNAPGLVKLLSLADFGGMVDALSGEGLSFEKLEMTMEKNNQVLNLQELYAIGPSISILMEGYVESKTGLVSLRGTMVPAKTLNKFLSKLPIVGDILIPKEIGEGLFGISFKMKGMPGKIKTTVNPIKTLTPRFIQKALKKTK